VDLTERAELFSFSRSAHQVISFCQLFTWKKGGNDQNFFMKGRTEKEMKIRITSLKLQDITFGKKFLACKVSHHGRDFWSSGKPGNLLVCPPTKGMRIWESILADTHIACMGIEKSLPERKASWVFSACLLDHATGQKYRRIDKLTFQKSRSGKGNPISMLVDNGGQPNCGREKFQRTH